MDWFLYDNGLCHERVKGGQNPNLETVGKICLLVTFIQRFVTQSKLSLIFSKTLLFPHKTTFQITHMTHTRMQMPTQS